MKTKNFFSNFFLILISIVIITLLLEVILKFSGKSTWYYISSLNEPIVNEFDEKLGWKPKKGIYKFPPYSENGKETKFTILEDGKRATDLIKNNSSKSLILLGGSFTQGQAVSDNQTYAWKLQKSLPKIDVSNYGVGGYGTYQSFLKLEEIFKKKNNKNFIIYSFLIDHEDRNVADPTWLMVLTKYSQRNHLFLPYARLDKENNLIKNKPIKYIILPLSEHSTLITRIQRAINNIKLKVSNKEKKVITKKIILEIKKLANKNKSKFIFVSLEPKKNNMKTYFEFLNKNEITYFDCGYKMKKDLVVEGEGHPNEKLHQLYSDCINKNIKLL